MQLQQVSTKAANYGSFLLFSRRFYLSVFIFKALDAVANQDEHLTVCGPAFIVCNGVELIQHDVVYSYCEILLRHRNASKVNTLRV